MSRIVEVCSRAISAGVRLQGGYEIGMGVERIGEVGFRARRTGCNLGGG